MTLLRRASSSWRKSAAEPAAAADKPATDDPIDEWLGRELLGLDGGLGLFRLAHLLHAFERAGTLSSALSVGSGGGLHETWLARRNSGVSVCGVDLRAPYAGVELPNLRFLQGNLLDQDFSALLPESDLVFSIECLEHIEDDRSVFARMAQLVRPGGHLYLEVPFATDSEQADPELCRRERETHEHVRPGYSATQLEGLARDYGLIPLEIAGAFWFPTQPTVWLAHLHLGGSAIAPHWRTFLAIAALDVKPGLPAHRAEATAIKMLARRPLR